MDIQSVMGVVRALLSGAGGLLVTKGYIGSSDLEVVIGAIVTVVPIVWSVLQKKGKVSA